MCPPKAKEAFCSDEKLCQPRFGVIPEPEPTLGSLRGRAMKTSGNCMSMICDEPSCATSCSTLPVQNTIYVYTAKKASAMTGEYLNIHSEIDVPIMISLA